MRRIVALELVLVYAGAGCGESPVVPAGTFYLSGTVTYAATGGPFEAEIDVYRPVLGSALLAETRSNAAGRYELTFYDSQCPTDGVLTVSATASGGGYLPATGVLPCSAKGSPYVVDLKMVLQQR
jgi:hypothetical protein